jgi:hypothetical protein
MEERSDTEFWLNLQNPVWQSLIEVIARCMQGKEWRILESTLVKVDALELCEGAVNDALILFILSSTHGVQWLSDIYQYRCPTRF